MATSRDMFNAAPAMLDGLEAIAKIALLAFRGDADESEAICVINNIARCAIDAAKPRATKP